MRKADTRALVRLAALGFATAAVGIQANALASTTFPAEVQELYSTANPPSCLVCHLTLAGGSRNSFGDAVHTAGGGTDMIKTDLSKALKALADAHTDTDGDGTEDVEELMRGTNPSDRTDAVLGVAEYGCIGSVAGHRPFRHGLAAIAGLLTAVALWHTRRRR
jgi:hypothetical protein